MSVHKKRNRIIILFLCFGFLLFLTPDAARAGESLVASTRRELRNLNSDVTDAVSFAEYMNLNLTRESVISWIEENRTTGLDYEGAKFYGWSLTRWWRCYNVNDEGFQKTGPETGSGYNCTGFAWSVYYYTHWKNEGYYSDGIDQTGRMKNYLADLYASYNDKCDLSNTAWFAFYANDHAEEINHFCLGTNLRNDTLVQNRLKEAEKANKIGTGDLIIYWNCEGGHDIHTAIYAGDGRQYEKNEYHPSMILSDAGAVSYNTAVYVFPVETPDRTGWKNDPEGWYYQLSDGSKAKSEYIDGYWLNADGYWTQTNKASWKQGKNGWWYGDESGWYAGDQWLKIDGVWYYFRGGYMVTGWQKIGDYWYFFRDGGMVTGWQKIQNNRYYFLNNGKMMS